MYNPSPSQPFPFNPPSTPQPFAITSSTPPPPIVLPCADYKPDMRIQVFNKEFHVHTVQMKIHSAWFRKLLDWPGTVAPADAQSQALTFRQDGGMGGFYGDGLVVSGQTGASRIWSGPAGFKYNLVTKVDADGKDWFLVMDDMKNQPYNLDIYTSFPIQQISAFKNFLYAIHGLPLIITAPTELERITHMGEYYCALPILGSSLDRALWNSRSFNNDIPDNALMLFALAAKLRNALLFRECLIWIAGAPHHIHNLFGVDDRLQEVIKKARDEISRKETGIMLELYQVLAKRLHALDDAQVPRRDFDTSLTNCGPAPWKMRKTYNELRNGRRELGDLAEPESTLRINLEMLLKDRLALKYDGQPRARTHDHSDQYYCTQILDEDLPWDVNETQW